MDPSSVPLTHEEETEHVFVDAQYFRVFMLGEGSGAVETPRCSPSASRAPGLDAGSLSGLSDQALVASRDRLWMWRLCSEPQRSPACLPALIMTFSSGLVWAGHYLGLGGGEVARDMPPRSTPGCSRNLVGKGCGRSQRVHPLDPSPDCMISQILDERTLVFTGLGVSRLLGGVTQHGGLNPKDKHSNTTCIFPV